MRQATITPDTPEYLLTYLSCDWLRLAWLADELFKGDISACRLMLKAIEKNFGIGLELKGWGQAAKVRITQESKEKAMELAERFYAGCGTGSV